MGRRKHRGPEDPAALYSDAYSFQQGEFHPEHHQANVRRLHEKYPGFTLSEIDTIYRQACRIEFEIQEQIGRSQLSEEAREKLLEWLEDHFHGFSRKSFLQAIDRVQSG